MFKTLSGVILALAVLVGPMSAEAQDVRTVSSRRQVEAEDELSVTVRFGAGTLRVQPAARGELYTTAIRYDADRFTASNRYDTGRLDLTVEGHRRVTTRTRESAELELGLGPEVPVLLDLKFGAADADVELGGVPTRRVQVSTGASDSRLRFSGPNPERLERLKIEAGAAAFHASGLGYANADEIEVSGGVGRIVLDFSGEWRGDTSAKVDLGLGSLTLRLPRGIGVKVSRETFLMSFDSQDLVRRGDAYYSQDWEDATHHLTLDISGAFGSIDVEWVDDIS